MRVETSTHGRRDDGVTRYRGALLADAEEAVRSALSLILSQEVGLRIVGEATTAGQLLSQLESTCPHLLLLAWSLPGQPPVDTMVEAVQRCPGMLILVLGSRPEERTAALKAGAHAFVSKVDPPQRLLETIRDLIQEENGRD
jgi:DNA-binding NarL/FixJ family response regulator